jgi:hypothetical protein
MKRPFQHLDSGISKWGAFTAFLAMYFACQGKTNAQAVKARLFFVIGPRLERKCFPNYEAVEFHPSSIGKLARSDGKHTRNFEDIDGYQNDSETVERAVSA